MCELLGVSLRVEGAPRILFRAFQGRADGDSPETSNLDGWGLAWYPDDKAAAVIKEAQRANGSALASFIGGYERLASRTFIAHVRRATRGEVVYRNAHPFCREMSGREYVFAHNGTLRAERELDTGMFQPVGETDSERLFCHLLNLIRTYEGISAESCVHLWDALLSINQLSASGRKSKINMLFTDGDTLIAYRDKFAAGTLYC